jgi:hypothetical protein
MKPLSTILEIDESTEELAMPDDSHLVAEPARAIKPHSMSWSDAIGPKLAE